MAGDLNPSLSMDCTLCNGGYGRPNRKGVLHIHNRKWDNPYLQLEEATQYHQPEGGQSISPTGKLPIPIPKRKKATPYSQAERAKSISPTRKGPVRIPILQKNASIPRTREEPMPTLN